MNKFKTIITTLSLFAIIILLESCVSKSKYEVVVFSRDSLNLVVDSMQLVINKLEQELRESNSNNDELLEALRKKQAELIDAKDNYNKLKNKSSNETQELLTQIENLQSEKIKLENQLGKTGDQLVEIKRLLSERDRKMDSLKNNLTKALLGFADKGLSVNIKNGKVYVSLSNQLLFSSGSTKIDDEGKNALLDLAKVLNENQDINILVEGHTDNQAVSGGSRFKDNWELSVLRATEVVKYLEIDGSVDPKRIIASGRGEYMPLEEGTSPDVRAMNRRTEIILTPNLEEIFEVIK